MAAWNLVAYQSRKWECQSVALTLGWDAAIYPVFSKKPDAPIVSGG
jgi:hypothetical protein